MAAAGKGQADWQGLWEGCHLWEGQRRHHEQSGNGEPERDPRFFDKPPGPRLETLGREVANPSAVVCFLLSYDVVGAGKSWEASGGCGEGTTAPEVGGERGGGPSYATCFSSISRSSFFWRTFSENWPQKCTCQPLRLFFPLFTGPLERSWLRPAGPHERSAARAGVDSPPAWGFAAPEGRERGVPHISLLASCL